MKFPTVRLSALIMLFARLQCLPTRGLRTTMKSTLTLKSQILEREHEKKLIAKGFSHVIGCDEAGRGALAGPVVAAAVLVLPGHESNLIEGVNDSKKLSEGQRNLIYDKIMTDSTLLTSFCSVPHNVIDQVNVLEATMIAMRTSINTVVEKKWVLQRGVSDKNSLPQEMRNEQGENIDSSIFALIDGNKCPKDVIVKTAPVIKGDSKVYCIALASIIAKVERDKHMKEMHKLYPSYLFDGHKGYPTQKHIQAIHQHGPSAIHRLTFKPLKGR